MNTSDFNGYVSINLVGGLCNQMFQISAGYCLSLTYNKKLNIKETSKNVHSSLNYFNNIFRKINPSPVRIFNTSYVFLLLFLEPPHSPLLHFEIPEHQNIELIGYFQNEKYFINYRNNILKLFEIEPEREIKLNNKYIYLFDSYFIHIRRGDYLKSDLHNVNLDMYFQKAIEYILSINSNARFYVFSDDITYCKTLDWLNKSNITFVMDLDEVDSLYLISMCKKGGIGCNSSFSWWGGYLNKNKDKLVIYPNRWFNSDWNVDIGWNGCHIMNINDYTINKKI